MSTNIVPKILAIIPCYNEEKALGQLLHEFRLVSAHCDTLVIDDGSTDASVMVARTLSPVIHLSQNQGLSCVIHAGIHYALENGYDYCVQIDGDGQHIPGEIQTLLSAMQTHDADIVIGSRYYPALLPRSLHIRRLAAFVFSIFIFVLYRGVLIYDPFSGMRMMNRRSMTYFYEHIDRHTIDAALTLKAITAKLRVRETHVKMRPRLYGKSHLDGFKGVIFITRLFYQALYIRFPKKQR